MGLILWRCRVLQKGGEMPKPYNGMWEVYKVGSVFVSSCHYHCRVRSVHVCVNTRLLALAPSPSNLPNTFWFC
jgi:hypothetical protein